MSWNASREVVAWAAQECEWQMSGEQSVLWMLDGRDWMQRCPREFFGTATIQKLAEIVEPRKNDGKSWRNCDVRVGFDVKLEWESVPGAMEHLVEALPGVFRSDADEWFRQYEEIHPFRDGNGRTGNILWNWLRGTLDQPEMPPNFWDDPRRAASHPVLVREEE